MPTSAVSPAKSCARRDEFRPTGQRTRAVAKAEPDPDLLLHYARLLSMSAIRQGIGALSSK